MEQHLTLAGAPALAVFQGSREDALRNGVVLFFHGLNGSKEVNAPELPFFAAKGFFAVGVDAVGHGARRYADFDARFGDSSTRRPEEFLNVVRATAREVPAVLDALVGLGASPEHMGICGASMGGFISYAAVLLDPRLKAAAPLLASPEWELPWPDSPHLSAERFFPVALFSQTAGDDEVVSPERARRFHARLEPLYAKDPERLRYREFPGAQHMMPHTEWLTAIRGAANWMARFI